MTNGIVMPLLKPSDMDTLLDIFGQGKDLDPLQMSARAVVIFLFCLILIRISGRRSFGMRLPLDNVITILLGAVLSRAIVGASPFVATVVASTVVVLLYRFMAWLTVCSHRFGKFAKGEERLVFKDGRLLEDAMKDCLVTRRDIEQEIRRQANANSLDEIEEIYVERNGEMGVVKKKAS